MRLRWSPMCTRLRHVCARDNAIAQLVSSSPKRQPSMEEINATLYKRCQTYITLKRAKQKYPLNSTGALQSIYHLVSERPHQEKCKRELRLFFHLLCGPTKAVDALKCGHWVVACVSEPLWGRGAKRTSQDRGFAKLRLFLPWRASRNLKLKTQKAATITMCMSSRTCSQALLFRHRLSPVC